MLVPSIDIMNGKAVQLRKGKELVIESKRDPLELARDFSRYGEIAVIDLNAATGNGDNKELIMKICRVADARVGGGIRDVDTGRQFLKAGARSIIIGTMATPEFLSKLPPERVMVALDHKDGEVLDQGWQHGTGETVLQRAAKVGDYCSGFLVTFVETEGMLSGLSPEKANSVAEKLKKPVTVAGGIASTEEVVAIAKTGLDVQVGMALYTGKVDPVEAVVGSIKFDIQGLVPTVVQDVYGQVLMTAYSNAESLRRALREAKGIYFSRSRKQVWEKGGTSGNTQELVSCRVDCDRDCLLFTVRQHNVACHRATYSCFGRATSVRRFSVGRLFDILERRKEETPEGSYSATLFKDRKKLLKKIMEEAYEVVSYTDHDNLRWEIADLIYFLSVLAVDEGLCWQDIESELGGRFK
jgi:phosphoribosyl-ATP pyrophosphohydrolase/phosphoribosyl-AMP cyclohydrolase